RVLRRLAGERRRVVWRAVVQRIEAAAGALQLHRHRFELPGDTGVGHPVRQEVRETTSAYLLRCEGEAGAVAIRRRDVQARTVAQRGVDTRSLCPGAGYVRVHPQVAQGQDPAEAEAARRIGRERVVAPYEGERLAGDLDVEVGDRVHEAAAGG